MRIVATEILNERALERNVVMIARAVRWEMVLLVVAARGHAPPPPRYV
jgi:hypothetical protein